MLTKPTSSSQKINFGFNIGLNSLLWMPDEQDGSGEESGNILTKECKELKYAILFNVVNKTLLRNFC